MIKRDRRRDLCCVPFRSRLVFRISIMMWLCYDSMTVYQSPNSFDPSACQPKKVCNPFHFIWIDAFNVSLIIFFFFLRYFFATLGRINDWNSDYVCWYKGRCNGMGHLERGWQTIVHSTRSWSSNYGEQRLRWKHKLYTKNDHWQHALCWLSRRWQKRLVPSKPLFDCGLMWISNDAIIWISILGGLRWAAHRATWWQTVWTSGHRFMGWEHFEC